MKRLRAFGAQFPLSKVQTLFKTALLLLVGTTTAVSAPTSTSHPEYSVGISLSDENGSPSRAQYRAGDNVWLRVAVTNLSTESLKVPKGEDYTQPKVLKDGSQLPYKKDISERIRRHESNDSYVDRGFWFLKPYQPEYDIVDLTYWYDLQPGYYQVYVERLFSHQQRAQSNSISFEVLPAIPKPTSNSAIVVRSVAPPYSAIAAAWTVSGTVLVDVQIDPDGLVTSANAASGPSLLRKAATDAAKVWRFNSVDPSAGSRSVRLTFIFRELSYAGNEEEQGFIPPYQMVVRRAAIALAKDQDRQKTPESFLKRTALGPWRMARKVF
jgi:TonB family protein